MKTLWRVFVLINLLLASASMGVAAEHIRNDRNREIDLVRPRTNRPHHSALDEEFNQLRYLKTTDYGQTWTPLQQAGNLETFAPTEALFPDFSAITTVNNDICFSVVLHEAATPGVYTLTGPDFTPVLAIPEGTNSFNGGISLEGWTDACRSPDGALIVITWGHDNVNHNTVWATKSTDNGATWETPWIVLTEPSLSSDAEYFHMSDLCSPDYVFVQFQTEGADGYDQHVMRFPVSGGLGTVTSLGSYSASPFSYYTGNCKPIAYDPVNNALYGTFRNNSLSATRIYYSNDQGQTFSWAEIPGTQRYPSMALNAASLTPWVISNWGVPAGPGEHCAWYSYDQMGYGGGSWTPQTELTCVSFDGINDNLIYMNQVYWWDANHGVASLNFWGEFTPDGINVTYTSNGGAAWADNFPLFHYEQDSIVANTIQNCELIGGTNGVAYIITSGASGATDTEPPVFSQLELMSDPASMGPYTVRYYIDDNFMVDRDNNWICWYNRRVNGGEQDFALPDSFDILVQERDAGWYYFTIPNVNMDGSPVEYGDTIRFYCDGIDLSGNYGSSDEEWFVAGCLAYIVQPSSDLSFGEVVVGDSLTITVTVISTDPSEQTISAILSPAGFRTDFVGPQTLMSGEQLCVNATFVPVSSQWYGGVLDILTSSLCTQTSMTVLGRGVLNPLLLSGPLSGELEPEIYHVVAGISIPSGDSLRLMAGVNFIFDGPYPFDIFGTLLAEGTVSDSILFTSDTLLNPYRWKGLRFRNASSSESRLAYCVIEHGSATGNLPDGGGGGLCCQNNASPMFESCSIRNNLAFVEGGGLYCEDGSAPVFTGCVISGNSAGWAGGVDCHDASPDFTDCLFNNNSAGSEAAGGIRCTNSFSTFTNCTIIDNQARDGGGLLCWNAAPVLVNCTISHNVSDFQGGGVWCYQSSPVFSNCSIEGNSAEIGGGIRTHNSSPVFTECTISGNSASWGGGGAMFELGSVPMLTNCSIEGNTASDNSGGIGCNEANINVQHCVISNNTAMWGGGVGCRLSVPLFSRCTFIGNAAGGAGGGVVLWSSAPSFINTIIAFSENEGIRFDDSRPSQIEYCNFYGNSFGNLGFTDDDSTHGPDGIGQLAATNSNGDSCDSYVNIFLDPLLVDMSTGDLHLLPGSPCIDAGDPGESFDPDGTIADIGAFFFQQFDTKSDRTSIPTNYVLQPNYPNPFNPSTTIGFGLPKESVVSIQIYDILGRRVEELVHAKLLAGSHSITWNATNYVSGTYLVVLQSPEFSTARKMVLIR